MIIIIIAIMMVITDTTTTLTRGSDGPYGEYSDDRSDNGGHVVVGTSHISCRLSIHQPVYSKSINQSIKQTLRNTS